VPLAHIGAARNCERLGEVKASVAHLEAALTPKWRHVLSPRVLLRVLQDYVPILVRQGDFQGALRDVETIMALGQDDGTWHQLSDTIRSMLTDATNEFLRSPTYEPIKSKQEKDLSAEKFNTEHLQTFLPVIIPEMATTLNLHNVTTQFLNQTCNKTKVYARRLQHGAIQTDENDMAFTDFLKRFNDGEADFLYKEPICTSCSKALKYTKVPKYVVNDIAQRIPYSVSPSDPRNNLPIIEAMQTVPSLGIFPTGTGLPLHLDGLMQHHWIIVISGRLRLAILDKLYSPIVTMLPPDQRDVFGDLPKNSLLRYVSGKQVVMEPGDFAFIPSGAAFQTLALAPTLTIHGVFLDELATSALVDNLDVLGVLEGVREALSSSHLDKTFKNDVEHMPFDEFSQLRFNHSLAHVAANPDMYPGGSRHVNEEDDEEYDDEGDHDEDIDDENEF